MNRRWVFAAALVAIAGLSVGLAFALRSSPIPGVPRPLGAPARVGRLTLPTPRGFNSYAMPVMQGPQSPLAARVVTNFRVAPDTTIDRALERWTAAQQKYVEVKNHNYGPPANEVALELGQYCRDSYVYCSGPGPAPPPTAQLHLPLSPDQPWEQERLASGAPGYRSGYLRFEGYLYYVMYWIGPDAPADDRLAVLRALGSIRPAS